MPSTLAGADRPQSNGLEYAENPAVVRRQGPVSECYAAELLLDEVPVLDDFDVDFESEDEDDDEDELDEESEDEEALDDFAGDDAGELLDEEPRLSLR